MTQSIPDRRNRTAIILAGGDGVRLREFTRNLVGHYVPKQFCPLVGNLMLLEQTQHRVSLSVPQERIFFTLNREHQNFYSPLLADVAPPNLIAQPCNRGTGPAILYSLLRVAETAPGASVLLMPSDHYVAEEAALTRYVEQAFAIVERKPELTLLLGIAPNEPETAYGWIELGQAIGKVSGDVFRVRRFCEKPSRQVATELMARRWLWNSFMIVGRVSTLLGLFVATMRGLYSSFVKIRPCLGTISEDAAARRLYQVLEASDFSRRVLEPVAADSECDAPRGRRLERSRRAASNRQSSRQSRNRGEVARRIDWRDAGAGGAN
jgi:mannose-1-phosphate guanylyltransferase